MTKYSILLSIILLSCSANINPSRIRAKNPTGTRDFSTTVYSDKECVKLSEDSDNWLFAAKFLGVGGVASISTVWIENETAKGITASVLATSAGFGVAALWMGEKKASKFKEFCEVTSEKIVEPVVNEKLTSEEKVDKVTVEELMQNPFEEDGGVEEK